MSPEIELISFRISILDISLKLHESSDDCDDDDDNDEVLSINESVFRCCLLLFFSYDTT